MERKPLHLPRLAPTAEPKKAVYVLPISDESGHKEEDPSETVVKMWTSSFEEEIKWMIGHFPNHKTGLSQIVLRPRQPSELFVIDNPKQDSKEIRVNDGYTSRDIEDFINMAIGVGSDVVAYEKIKQFVPTLKTTRTATQRMLDSLCVMSASSFAGQSGEYSLGAILDRSPTKIARSLPPLFDGYLSALAEFENSVKFGAPPDASKFVPNTSPLMQEPLTCELIKKEFFSASVLMATMAPHIGHRGKYEQELIEHVSEAQKEGVVAPGSQVVVDIRGYMRASSKFAAFLEQASSALLDPSHPHHVSIINSVREYQDHDIVEAILLLMCNADGSKGVEALVATKMQISFLASQGDEAGRDVFARLRDSVESYIETYDIDTSLPVPPASTIDTQGIGKEAAAIIAERGERMRLSEVDKSTPKTHPQSEIGDIKRKMAKERREKLRLTEGLNVPEKPNEPTRPAITKRLLIEDDTHVDAQIAHLTEGEQAIVRRAIGYYKEFGLGMRKLRSAPNLYRLRAGGHRVIFELSEDGGLRLLGVSKKSNSTYKEL